MKSEHDGYELFMDKGHKVVELSGSEETYAYMEEINSRWNRVQTKLAEKEAAIARLLSTCTPFYQNLNSFSESISAATRLSSELMRSPNSGEMSHRDMRSKEEVSLFLKIFDCQCHCFLYFITDNLILFTVS